MTKTLTRGTVSTVRAVETWAVRGTFFVTGAIFATWTSRLPAVKAGLGLSDGQLGFALLALNAGALVGLQLAPSAIRRWGSRRTLLVALPAYALSPLAIAAAVDLPTLVGAVILGALVNSVVDVAMNVSGVTVERRRGRRLLSSLHAMHTLGGIVGAVAGAVAARLSGGVGWHFAGAASVGVALALVSVRWLPSDDTRPATGAESVSDPGRALNSGRVSGARGGRRIGWRFVLLGVMAFAVVLAEGGANDWAAVYLRDDLAASESFAALGLAAFLTAMTVGRLAGDRLSAWLGAGRLVGIAAAIAGVGLGLALLSRDPVIALAGFAVLGAGVSVTLPTMLREVGRPAVGSRRTPADRVARLSTVAYAGAFAGPAMIGAIAAGSSLRLGLILPAAACVLAAVLAMFAFRDREPR